MQCMNSADDTLAVMIKKKFNLLLISVKEKKNHNRNIKLRLQMNTFWSFNLNVAANNVIFEACLFVFCMLLKLKLNERINFNIDT